MKMHDLAENILYRGLASIYLQLIFPARIFSCPLVEHFFLEVRHLFVPFSKEAGLSPGI